MLFSSFKVLQNGSQLRTGVLPRWNCTTAQRTYHGTFSRTTSSFLIPRNVRRQSSVPIALLDHRRKIPNPHVTQRETRTQNIIPPKYYSTLQHNLIMIRLWLVLHESKASFIHSILIFLYHLFKSTTKQRRS